MAGDCMTQEHIPVYSIHDLAKTEADINFEVTTLDNAFLSARQDVLNPHRHDFFEVFWIERGSGSLTIDFECNLFNFIKYPALFKSRF